MRGAMEFGTYNALIENGYLDREQDPKFGIPPSILDPDNPHRIDPDLYNNKAGDVSRPGTTIDPATGEQLTPAQEYERWKSGPSPDEQSSDEYNGPPSEIFEAYLQAYASHAYGQEPK